MFAFFPKNWDAPFHGDNNFRKKSWISNFSVPILKQDREAKMQASYLLQLWLLQVPPCPWNMSEFHSKFCVFSLYFHSAEDLFPTLLKSSFTLTVLILAFQFLERFWSKYPSTLAALWFTSQSDLRITRTGLHSVKLSNEVLFECVHWELLLHQFVGPD